MAFARLAAAQYIQQMQIDGVKRMAGENHRVVVFHSEALHLHTVSDGAGFIAVVNQGVSRFSLLVGVVVNIVHGCLKSKIKNFLNGLRFSAEDML
jgi:hypothetical protein